MRKNEGDEGRGSRLGSGEKWGEISGVPEILSSFAIFGFFSYL
jgi:hypothetical protein